MTKNTIRMFCAAAAVVLLFSSCGKKPTASGDIVENTGKAVTATPESTKDGEVEASTALTGDLVAVVNGEALNANDMGYYIYNNAVIKVAELNGENANAAALITSFDWDAEESDGVSYKESVINAAIDDAVNDLIFKQMAEERGYSVLDAEKESARMIDSAVEASGDDKILNNIHLLGISDIDEYKEIYTNIAVFEGVADEFGSNPNKYIDDPDVLSDYAGSKGATVQSILISADTDKGNMDEVAAEVCNRAKDGENFVQLMKSYNDDTNETEAGYTFPEGEMQRDFEKAVFALDINEVSDVVSSDRGCYVLKRIAGAYELQNYWRRAADVTIAENAEELVGFDSVMNMIKAAGEAV